VKLSQK